ncbi:gluconolactonase [Bisgaardia hudsonensis]|uniref:Gluconolactonase n=1 Tax=Bisgaardia hudsonensis TaxID=109472 RepID=A0A4R2MYF7_9PAST|nr:SMP-30/gluconolactonase/LRE family protein [Bisgaardia hudsonensis]QLB13743.1 gluconolactonase [Bisgaardia hudsonensis]TCP11072.1 gluconolactonase [Bisgaardia hudsonensis]
MNNLNIEVYDDRFYQLVGNNFKLDELYDQVIWAEGPVWQQDTGFLIFSDVKGNRMYRWSESEGTQVFRDPSYFSNGNSIDTQGNLVTCEHGRRCISRTNKDGEIVVLVDNIEGKKLNSPNDVVVKSDGSIWFTDPPYGILSNDEGQKAPSEIIGCYVYRFDPITQEINIATFNTMRPNGLAFSPDEKTLFVADMSVVEFQKNGLHHLVAFDVNGKYLENRRTVSEINPGIPDGFRISQNGLIFCSCGTGIIVLLTDGTKLGQFVLNKTTSNCAFGSNEQTLFITATNSLYRLTMN